MEKALAELQSRRPGIRRAVVKLDESFSGEGNALFRYPASDSKLALAEALQRVEFAVPTETPETYFDKMAKMGGIVEEYIEADEKHSPSAQLRIGPRGEVFPISTHDQILGGPSGQVFLGCRFPARDDYRLGIQEAGERVGHQLSAHGVVSRFGVDFLVHRDSADEPWKTTALDLNPVVLTFEMLLPTTSIIDWWFRKPEIAENMERIIGRGSLVPWGNEGLSSRWAGQ